MVVLGIDPGKKGALVWLKDNEVIHTETMPLKPDSYGDEIVDGAMIYQIVTAITPVPRLIIVERQHSRPTDRKKSIFTLGRGYGCLECALDLTLLPRHTVAPETWKAAVLKGTDRSKQATIGYVKQLFPLLDLRPHGSKKDHDGIADAVCIGLYGQRFLQQQG